MTSHTNFCTLPVLPKPCSLYTPRGRLVEGSFLQIAGRLTTLNHCNASLACILVLAEQNQSTQEVLGWLPGMPNSSKDCKSQFLRILDSSLKKLYFIISILSSWHLHYLPIMISILTQFLHIPHLLSLDFPISTLIICTEGTPWS